MKYLQDYSEKELPELKYSILFELLLKMEISIIFIRGNQVLNNYKK